MKYANFSTLTVGQYQQLYQINRTDDDETDKAVQSISVLTGLTRWEIEDMPLPKFQEMARAIALIFSIQPPSVNVKRKVRVGGKRYTVVLNPRKHSAGQAIEIQTFMSGNIIENLHKIMASLLVPRTMWGTGKRDAANHEQLAEAVQGMNFLTVYSTCIFFSALWTGSLKAIQAYLDQELAKNPEMKNLMEEIPGLTNLPNIMGGYIALDR